MLKLLIAKWMQRRREIREYRAWLDITREPW